MIDEACRVANYVTEANSKNKEVETSTIELFPNPAKSDLNIKFKSRIDELYELSIYDTTGKLIQNKNLNSPGSRSQKLDVSELNNGLYWLKIKSKNFSQTHRFIVAN